MAKYLKLYIDTLDIYSVARLPDHLWRRFMELRLVAIEYDQDGMLPDENIIAWYIRVKLSRLKENINTLLEMGLLEQREGNIYIPPIYWANRYTGNEIYTRHQEFVFGRDNERCVYCGSNEDLSLDHVIPQIQGGSHKPENLVTCCKPCNSRKGGRTPEQANMTMKFRTLH